MRIVRINKGKTVPFPIRFIAVLVIATSSIKLVQILDEPWSILVLFGFGLIAPAIWFSTNIFIINLENKLLFDGIWVMGFKFGRKVPFDSIEKFFVNKVKTKQTIYSLANNQNIVANHEYQAYVKIDSDEKFFLLSHPLKERIDEKLVQIKKMLQIKD